VTTVLKNVLPFTGLAVAVPASLPHKLNVNSVPVKPQFGALSASGFTVQADATNVTVTRTTGGADVDVYVEHWHTIEDCEPPGGLNALTPFFVESGVNGGGGRAVLASCVVDGTIPAYLNVFGFGPVTRNGPVGDYNLGLFPGADIATINFATGVFSIDGQPAVLTVLSGIPGTVRFLVTHLDGTPVDATFSAIVFSST
jgi:hypothetical protein